MPIVFFLYSGDASFGETLLGRSFLSCPLHLHSSLDWSQISQTQSIFWLHFGQQLLSPRYTVQERVKMFEMIIMNESNWIIHHSFAMNFCIQFVSTTIRHREHFGRIIDQWLDIDHKVIDSIFDHLCETWHRSPLKGPIRSDPGNPASLLFHSTLFRHIYR